MLPRLGRPPSLLSLQIQMLVSFRNHVLPAAWASLSPATLAREITRHGVLGFVGKGHLTCVILERNGVEQCREHSGAHVCSSPFSVWRETRRMTDVPPL